MQLVNRSFQFETCYGECAAIGGTGLAVGIDSLRVMEDAQKKQYIFGFSIPDLNKEDMRRRS